MKNSLYHFINLSARWQEPKQLDLNLTSEDAARQLEFGLGYAKNASPTPLGPKHVEPPQTSKLPPVPLPN